MFVEDEDIAWARTL